MTTPDLERRVLRRAFIFFAVATLGFWLVNGLSVAEEWRRGGEAGAWVRALALEGVSGLVVLALFIPAALLERRFPATPERWKTAIPVHLLGWLVFAGVHVAAMNAVRMAIWPLVFDLSYRPFDDLVHALVYEFRKDALTYALILAVLAMVRGWEDALQRAEAVRSDARLNHRIALRSGGRELRLPVEDIVSASAAGNYVDVATAGGSHLARMTLDRLQHLLEEAGGDPVRLHRSHLASRRAIRAITPTGGGEAEAVLSDGRRLPVSRSRRTRL